MENEPPIRTIVTARSSGSARKVSNPAGATRDGRRINQGSVRPPRSTFRYARHAAGVATFHIIARRSIRKSASHRGEYSTRPLKLNPTMRTITQGRLWSRKDSTDRSVFSRRESRLTGDRRAKAPSRSWKSLLCRGMPFVATLRVRGGGSPSELRLHLPLHARNGSRQGFHTDSGIAKGGGGSPLAKESGPC